MLDYIREAATGTCSPNTEIQPSDTQHQDSNIRYNLPIVWYSQLTSAPMRLPSPVPVGTGQGLAFLGRETARAPKVPRLITTQPLPSGRPGRASEHGSNEAVLPAFDVTPCSNIAFFDGLYDVIGVYFTTTRNGSARIGCLVGIALGLEYQVSYPSSIPPRREV